MAPSQTAVLCSPTDSEAKTVVILQEPNWTAQNQWVRENCDLVID